MKKIIITLISSLLITIGTVGCNGQTEKNTALQSSVPASVSTEISIITPTDSTLPDVSASASNDTSQIPDYSGSPYVVLNDNQPTFAELTTESYEYYSDLDNLGRCGKAESCIGKDLMPTEKRGSIGTVKPTGWHTVKYDNVDGKYLYNRCHLIGFQLTAENANEKNLITGTRYLNVDGMLPFENMVADYIKETNNHVMYRVTPVFEENNLVASGVQMEAYSVEDNGEGICFNVFCYNVQPGITINYADGSSYSSGSTTEAESENPIETSGATASETKTYILNTKTKKFHLPSCTAVDKMADSNKQEYISSREDVIDQGYTPCGICKP